MSFFLYCAEVSMQHQQIYTFLCAAERKKEHLFPLSICIIMTINESLW